MTMASRLNDLKKVASGPFKLTKAEKKILEGSQ